VVIKEVARGPSEPDVVVLATTDVEHGGGGVEAEHAVLTFEVTKGLVEIQSEIEVVI
jgi:hypothetical protein